MWFGEGNAAKIGRITPDGTVTEFSAGITAGAHIYNLTAGPDGNIWFSEEDTNKIGRITTAGVVTEFSQGITGNNHLHSIKTKPHVNRAKNGSHASTVRPNTQFDSSLSGITTGPDGNLWFAQYNTGQIGSITTTGVVTRELSIPTNFGDEPYAIALGTDNNIWFSDQSSSNGEIGRCAIAS